MLRSILAIPVALYFNMRGEVIGIASFILSESGGFEGIGFAASSNLARAILMEENHIWGGMTGVYVNGAVGGALNVPGQGGFLITSTSSKGLGAQIGLLGGTVKANIEGADILIGGDVILAIAGVETYDESSAALVRHNLAEMAPGSEVEITILRKGKVMSRTFRIPAGN